MRLLAIFTRRLSALALACMLVAGAAIPAAAQNQVPDMTQFGFPQVTGTVNFTPGQATTLTAGNQKLDIPADLLTMPVKFEFLEGDPAFFAQNLTGDDQGKQVLATFAFRVTDPATGQLVGKFDKPVVWSVTGSAIDSESEVYNVSATTPPKITENSTPGTLQGNTLTHSFGGAGVGWIVLGPPAAPAPAGMPTTGAGIFNGVDGILPLALLAGALVLAGGLALRRRARHTA
jgi:hypothetical protein